MEAAKGELSPKETKIKTERNSSLELLRIIVMILIIFHHWIVHGGYSYASIPQYEDWLYLFRCLRLFSFMGVPIFAAISGYFLIHSTKVKWEKPVKIMISAFLYAAIWGIILVSSQSLGFLEPKHIYGVENPSFSDYFFFWLKIAFAWSGRTYWFVGAYLFVYLLHPLINSSFAKLTFKWQILTASLITFFSMFLPTFLGDFSEGSNVLIFLTCYLWGAILGYNKERINLPNIYAFLIFLASLALSYGYLYLVLRFPVSWGVKSGYFASLYSWAIWRTTIFTLLPALCLVYIFSRWHFASKLINVIASTMLGVYLIHESIGGGLVMAWSRRNEIVIGSTPFFQVLLNILAFVFGWLIVGIAIDLLRIYLLERPLFLGIRKISERKRK